MLSAAAACLLAGMLMIHGAPPRWRLDSWQGILLGMALYMGVVHRWLVARQGTAANANHRGGGAAAFTAWDLAWRLAAFVGIVAGEAYAYYEWLPAADLRAPFVMLSGWIVAETMLAPRAAATTAAVSAASRRG
jgi:hypothetical protein